MEDLVQVLTKFHREIVLPDVERIVGESEQRLRNEMHTLFDALSQQIQELRTEYHMLLAGLKRVEERLDRVEQRLDKMALRSELLELKSRVDGLARAGSDLGSPAGRLRLPFRGSSTGLPGRRWPPG